MSHPQPPQGPQQPFQQQMPYGQPPHVPQFAPQQPKKKAKKWPWVVGVLAFLFVIGSISNGGKTPTSTNTADSAGIESSTTTPATTTPAPQPSERPAPTTSVAPAPAPVQAAPLPKTCTVPNVVGMVHQYAQDTMQAAGLFILREEDATGQGRLLLYDRNWKTTAQSVAAGAVVDCGTEIMLSAQKIGE
jgi:hypothetical protein